MAMNGPTKTDDQRRSPAAIWLIAVVALLPVIYALSVGPATVLKDPARRIINWYLRLWG